MFAIIDVNNVQFKVEEGKEYELPEFEYDEKKPELVFDKVLLIQDGDKTLIGAPVVEKAKVNATCIGIVRGDKVRVFKFRAKKRYKKTAGHVQDYVKIKIDKIITNDK